RAVLAPLRGAFTSFVSLSDRHCDDWRFGARAGWLWPLPGGPRAASRCPHFVRQPFGPTQTRVLRGCVFRPLPCGRILASSLRSALRITLQGPQSARFQLQCRLSYR
ncbi:hypothetical protein, partial [Erwinia sp. S43]|uniref:hypothetical protein n=1 Tax=Erwinia sp. S43 TaxID=2769339 RepID=UPI001F48E094